MVTMLVLSWECLAASQCTEARQRSSLLFLASQSCCKSIRIVDIVFGGDFESYLDTTLTLTLKENITVTLTVNFTVIFSLFSSLANMCAIQSSLILRSSHARV